MNWLRKVFRNNEKQGALIPHEEGETSPPARSEIVVNDEGVFRRSGGIEEFVPWQRLTEVVFVVNADDRFEDRRHIVLVGEENTGVAVPYGLAVESGLLEVIPRLENFDSQALSNGVNATEKGHFVCWRRGHLWQAYKQSC